MGKVRKFAANPMERTCFFRDKVALLSALEMVVFNILVICLFEYADDTSVDMSAFTITASIELASLFLAKYASGVAKRGLAKNKKNHEINESPGTPGTYDELSSKYGLPAFKTKNWSGFFEQYAMTAPLIQIIDRLMSAYQKFAKNNEQKAERTLLLFSEDTRFCGYAKSSSYEGYEDKYAVADYN